MKLYGDEKLELVDQSKHRDIIFKVNTDKESGGLEMLRLCSNGDILVKGNLATNDLEIVEAFKLWVNQNIYKG